MTPVPGVAPQHARQVHARASASSLRATRVKPRTARANPCGCADPPVIAGVLGALFSFAHHGVGLVHCHRLLVCVSSRVALSPMSSVYRSCAPRAQVVLNSLYKHTALQSRFPCNAVAIVAGTPQTLALKQFLAHFLDFRVDVVRRRAQCDPPLSPSPCAVAPRPNPGMLYAV